MTTVTRPDNHNPAPRPDNHSPALPRGRLIFALDATASREAGWETARALQAKMFRAAAPIGHLMCKLVFYKGAECKASKWADSGDQLASLMNQIACESGFTQIGRVLTHALREAEIAPVQALIFVGDSMEEDIETLAAMASKLGALKVPLFMFQEGNDAKTRKAFKLLALKSGGAFFEFNTNSSRAVNQLSERLNAIARFAVGDTAALQRVGVNRGPANSTASIGVRRDIKK